MPLNTQIIRKGEALKLKWSGFHLACMVIAASADSGKGPWSDEYLKGLAEHFAADETPSEVTREVIFSLTNYLVIAATPLNNGDYTLVHGYKFVDQADGELLELKPGDVLQAYRSSF